MKKILLPPVREDKVLHFDHFPTRFHAAVFRLWETVPAVRIAKGLSLPLEAVMQAADDMGLPRQNVSEYWRTRGYITTIRNCWQILPYEQLLGILEWDEERLATVLKEDDFLSIKLGRFKPYCEAVTVEPLSDSQRMQLEEIRKTMMGEFSDLFGGEAPFSFIEEPSAPVDIMLQKPEDGIRMIYSYCGLYANVLDEDISVSFPESMLAQYQKAGVNAVWLQGVLYQLTPFPFDESYSIGWEKRLERLAQLVELGKKYGIRVYLYLNEPRGMPMPFFSRHPELLGRQAGENCALCSCDERVWSYLHDAVDTLCRHVPDLGGFMVITMSENLTHCKSLDYGTPCEKCEDKPAEELVARVLTTISEASRAVNPEIRTMANAWAWDTNMTQEARLRCIDLLPKEIILLCVSENKKKFCIGGIEGEIVDYSMAIPGPSDLPKQLWKYAAERGHEVAAKVQVNCTWECSTVPYLPVFDLVREHMIGLKEVDVKHLMLSWTLGGYPSINLKIAAETLKNPNEAHYDQILEQEYGADAAKVKRAATIFSEAFRNFPFHVKSLYRGPQNGGPSNLLFAKPTGFESTMTCYSYDDLDSWRAIYPREVYLEQWRKLTTQWQEGLQEITDMPECEFKWMAQAGGILFASSYLQAKFVVDRDKQDNLAMLEIITRERENAKRMYELMGKTALIGYEASNHYFFNKGMLAEKTINCDYLLRIIQ